MKFYTAIEAATELGISRRWFFKLIETGKIPTAEITYGNHKGWSEEVISNVKQEMKK